MSYQQRDWEIVDYQEFCLDEVGLTLRGPRPPSLAPGDYFSCIGAAQTYGCFELWASPLVVDYDELIAAPQAVVRSFLNHLGLDGSAGDIQSRTSMQRLGSRRADEIKRAFEEYHGLNARD